MNAEVPYLMSVTNLHKILDAIQKAGTPEAFGLDFLKDLGFTSSNDRGVIKLFKYLGLLDTTGKPLTPYREFMDSSKAKSVLGGRLRASYDDLFLADKEANNQNAAKLKGWFKTKTGASEAVAEKMATTFKSLASYATFDPASVVEAVKPTSVLPDSEVEKPVVPTAPEAKEVRGFTFAYRNEVHLPDTTNIDTYRAIFRALREELA